jgi:cyanophycinase
MLLGRKPVLPVVMLLAGLAVFGQSSRGVGGRIPLQKSTEGTIVLGGGYFEAEKSATLLTKIIDLAGGTGISLVIIPTAEPAVASGPSVSRLDFDKATRSAFARLGVQHVTVLHTRDRKVADSDAFVAPLRSANCVWIPGGATQLLFDVYPNTKVQRELKGMLRRGGVLAGDSAGAIIASEGLLAIDPQHPEMMPVNRQPGLGLVPNLFVLAHINRYKPGVVELGSETYVASHPQASSVLIEEHTAIMIRNGQISRLTGSGRAGIVDGRSHGTDPILWLSGSARYDLRARDLVH